VARALELAAPVLVSLAALVALAWIGQRRLIYFPSRDVPAPEAVGLTAIERIAFTAGEGLPLNGWYVPASGRAASLTVIVFNGNAGNRAYRADFATALARLGAAVLLFDYRGFGDNPGSPSEAGLIADARAARAYAAGRGDVDGRRLVYFGESLGAAVAVALAAEHPPAALILRSPFASLAAVGQHHYPLLPVRLLLRDRFASIDKIRQIRCPLLVIAGDRDRIVPLDHSRHLYERALPPKKLVVIDGADHNDEALFTGREMMRAIAEFLGGI
jgi:hypothetical protein